jgi:phosphotransferase system enzyme I (PtsI)
LIVPELLPHVDFLSIGSNDLTQYTMAAGRENGSVRDYFLESHPAMLRLMARTVSDAGSTPVCLCGELAGRAGAMPALLACGLREFSVASSLLAQVRRSVRSADAHL